jgi:F-type H+-transporting ATPase subunit delta
MNILSQKYAVGLYELAEKTDKNEINGKLKDFVNFIIENKDHGKIEEIVNEFSKIWDKNIKELKVSVSSVHKLSNDSKDIIIEYLKERTNSDKIDFIENIDESVIGGVILRYGDKIIDASLKNNLNNLKNNINK